MNRFCGHSEIVTVNYMKIEGPPKSNGLIVAGRAIKRGAKKKFCNGYTCKNFTKYSCVLFSEHSKFFFILWKKIAYISGVAKNYFIWRGLFDGQPDILETGRKNSRTDGHTSDDRIWAYYRRQNGQTPTTEYWHTTDDRNRYTTDNRTDILLTTGYGLTTDERTDKLPTTGRTYADGHLYRTNIHRKAVEHTSGGDGDNQV